MGPAHLILAALAWSWPVATPPAPAAPAPPAARATAPAAPAPITAPPAAPPIPAPPAVEPIGPPLPSGATSPTPVRRLVTPPVAAIGSRVPAATATASAKPRRPLYRRWWFWTIAGGVFTAVVATTYAVTRPPPTPYFGNGQPGVIDFP